MEKKIFNYRVIIEPEKMGRKTVYNAYCPSLGIADYGDSIEKALDSMRDGIELAIQSLKEEGKEVPKDNIEEQFITAVRISTSFQ